MSDPCVSFILVERNQMNYQLEITYPDQTVSFIHISESQKEAMLDLTKGWFDNGLITAWRLFY